MNKGSLNLASSFRNKMILIFFAITIVPFFVFAYYSYQKSVEGIQIANATFSMSYLQQTKENFETYLGQVDDQINDLVGNRSASNGWNANPATKRKKRLSRRTCWLSSTRKSRKWTRSAFGSSR